MIPRRVSTGIFIIGGGGGSNPLGDIFEHYKIKINATEKFVLIALNRRGPDTNVYAMRFLQCGNLEVSF